MIGILSNSKHTQKKTNFAIFLFPSPHYFFAFISFVDKTFDPKNQIKKRKKEKHWVKWKQNKYNKKNHSTKLK